MPKLVPSSGLAENLPDFFNELYVNTVPLKYLQSIRLEFSDGRIWEITISDYKDYRQEFADRLFQVLEEYSKELSDIHYKIDTKTLVKDIKQATKKYL